MRSGLEILHQCGKSVKNKSERVLVANFSVKGKVFQRVFTEQGFQNFRNRYV